jgi:hypothetical protein
MNKISANRTRLETRLAETDQHLYGVYQQVVELARVVMPRAYSTHWSFTGHEIDHTHRVVEIIDSLCTDALVASFRREELFALLGGTILHSKVRMPITRGADTM